MKSYREIRRRHKALVNETFRSANPFWRTWKEAALVDSVVLGGAILLFILFALGLNDFTEVAGVAGTLGGGASGFYHLFIYAPRHKKAWVRAKNETLEKYGTDKYDLMMQKFDNAKVTTTYDAVGMWVSLAAVVGLFGLVHSTLGAMPALAVFVLSVVAYFIIRHRFRMNVWKKIETEVEADFKRSRQATGAGIGDVVD